jgi:hypothetical protein
MIEFIQTSPLVKVQPYQPNQRLCHPAGRAHKELSPYASSLLHIVLMPSCAPCRTRHARRSVHASLQMNDPDGTKHIYDRYQLQQLIAIVCAVVC